MGANTSIGVVVNTSIDAGILPAYIVASHPTMRSSSRARAVLAARPRLSGRGNRFRAPAAERIR